MNQSSGIPSMTPADSSYSQRNVRNQIQAQSQHPKASPIQRPTQVYLNPILNHHFEPKTNKATHCVSPTPSDTSSSVGSIIQEKYQPRSYRSHSKSTRGFMAQASPYHSPRSTQSQNGAHLPHSGQPDMIEDNVAVMKYIRQQDTLDEEEKADHAIKILLWLSFVDPLYCLFAALFSISTAFVLLVISPIKMCRSQFVYGTSLIRILAPIFRKHLQILHASSVQDAHTFDFNAVLLVLMYLLSPLFSVAIALSSWIAGAFWLFAITMGNPDGTERKDDGRATVLMVRNWWEKYLLYAIRQ